MKLLIKGWNCLNVITFDLCLIKTTSSSKCPTPFSDGFCNEFGFYNTKSTSGFQREFIDFVLSYITLSEITSLLKGMIAYD